jgi:hypothetical protein
MVNIYVSLLISLFLQGGNKIQIDDVKGKADDFDVNKITYGVFGSFNVEPFDIKGRDAYVLVLYNTGEQVTLNSYKKFSLTNVAITNYNWTSSFTIDSPDDDFNVYAILVDRFNDKYFEKFQEMATSMGSFEEIVGALRKTDRIDPLNFSVFWVRIN